MNYKMIGKYISRILMIEAVLMVQALIIAIATGDKKGVIGFLTGIGAAVFVSAVIGLMCRNARQIMYAKDGFVCVGLSWIAMSLIGCIPFVVSGAIPSFVDALFETVSGFTTTGSSILNDIESLSKGILYWRSFTHWVGGMGVLVFLLALSSSKENAGFTMHLLRAESPGPDVGKLVPHIKETAKILYYIYIGLTVLCILFLLAGGMPLFDSVCTSFGTAGTGGFGIKNDSIAGYSPYLQNVVTVFMLLFGVNFSCYYLIILKQIKAVFKDEELRAYLGIVICATLAIAWNIRGLYSSIGETLRYSAFQVVTIITTTGFATTDFDLWPSFSKAILYSLMFLGACAGSTGGGLKVGRLLILVKSFRRNVRQVLNPNHVQTIQNNGKRIDDKIVLNTQAYFAAYILIIFVSYMIVSLDNFSIATNFSAVVACFNNIGPGFEGVGPTCNFAHYSILSKIVLIVDMLAGRLEIFPILILLSKNTWKRK
ncbi:MAG: TrkH family potassium uptake protein [Clostridiales bacterium]|nr:TrkH family potassium uptake protein [Clostridiales bacterium]